MDCSSGRSANGSRALPSADSGPACSAPSSSASCRGCFRRSFCDDLQTDVAPAARGPGAHGCARPPLRHAARDPRGFRRRGGGPAPALLRGRAWPPAVAQPEPSDARLSAPGRPMGRGPGPAQADPVTKPRSLWQRLARRWRDPLLILPYVSYGTAQKLVVRGRVLEDEGFMAAGDADTRWRNLVSFYKRLESDEVPGARIRARFLGVATEATTDREGYFKLELAPRGRLGPGMWQEVALELLDTDVKATARVLVPPTRARFGVISDIDDTIVASHVTNKLKMILTVALSNARTRKPFPGVAAFYRALHAGVNPVFYVSKSPWNLYAPLLEYLEVQGLPLGPLLLRDFGFSSNKKHKTEAIEHILAVYPRMKFILIGDSGEQDPEIYAAMVRKFPARIRAIYIRSVSPERVGNIEKLAAEVAKTGCQLVLAPHAGPAAAHAAAEGLIQASELRAVRAGTRLDSIASNASAPSGSLK